MGNRCDPDYDGSLTTTVADFAVFLGALGTSGYDEVFFEVPPGSPGEIVLFEKEVGAPGGQCANGVHCYANGTYSLADRAKRRPFRRA